jgi:hypothetical protein
MSQNDPKCATLREFFFGLPMERTSSPAFLGEFSIWTRGQVAGARALVLRKMGKLCVLGFSEKTVFLYKGPAGEGFGRGRQDKPVICLGLNSFRMGTGRDGPALLGIYI